jgi:RNA polymerase sigma factor (sigma-70 family)
MSCDQPDPAFDTLPVDSTSGATEEQRVAAISALFREHNRALVNFLLTRLPSEAEAREVAQEAYVRLLQLDQPVAAGFLRWYLFKIAKGIAVDRHRQRTTRQRIDQLDALDDLDLSSPTENSVMASDELAQMLATLRELPCNCQQAFQLHRFRDLSTVEVARIMGLTDRMVRKHVQKALVYCRLRLEGFSKEEAMRQVTP